MPMRGVIFDIGGVLEITPETGWQRKSAHRLGISAAALEARLEPIWAPGTTGEVRWTRSCGALGSHWASTPRCSPR